MFLEQILTFIHSKTRYVTKLRTPTFTNVSSNENKMQLVCVAYGVAKPAQIKPVGSVKVINYVMNIYGYVRAQVCGVPICLY